MKGVTKRMPLWRGRSRQMDCIYIALSSKALYN
uniref:Uncharacterized protein n=1 Tax=Anguilla anguilla TaxID=7936 RepID=A0A0E9QEH5_ANGAN